MTKLQSLLAPILSENFRTATVALALTLAVALAQPAAAQTFSVIHSFTGGADGANPSVSLTVDRGGNLYGTAFSGGAPSLNCGGLGGCGTAFKLTRRDSAWIMNPLYSFTGGSDGAGPDSPLLFGPDGALYSTANGGGDGNCTNGYFPACGVVFKLQPPPTACTTALCSWTETPLYQFSDLPDGQGLEGNLAFDQAGNIYGATYAGGTFTSLPCGNGFRGCGTVYKLTRSGSSWVKTAIHNFTGGDDGGAPSAGVILDAAGNLYGTAELGGTHNAGVVFELTPSGSGWAERVLYDFTGGTDEGYPVAGLVFDGAGNLYGAATGGGPDGGAVFELSPSGGNWVFTVLHTFQDNQGGPEATPVFDQGGSLYGTTVAGGAFECGNVYKLTPSGGNWSYASLHDFTCGNDGGVPYGGVAIDGNGNLFGTTFYYGPSGDVYCGADAAPVGCGVAWEITP